ncbi:MAG: YvcK family protein, partial [Clostridia bacterium]|nr:YvcK family protein [Clostridia bacterium]
CQRWGLRTRVLPMSDEPVATQVITPAGRLAFQDYLVRRGARDRVLALAFEGAEAAVPAPGVGEAIEAADLVVIGPSNPFVSIAPILSVAGVRERLAARGGRRFAVSPMIGDRAVKGPLADMLASLGYPVGPLGVAQFYRGLVDVFVVDESDRALAGAIEAFGMEARAASILLRDAESRRRLAEQILEWADEEAG